MAANIKVVTTFKLSLQIGNTKPMQVTWESGAAFQFTGILQTEQGKVPAGLMERKSKFLKQELSQEQRK